MTFRERVANAIRLADEKSSTYSSIDEWLLGLADAALEAIASELELSVAEIEKLTQVTDCDDGSVAVFGSDRFKDKVASRLGAQRPMHEVNAYRRKPEPKPRHVDDRI